MVPRGPPGSATAAALSEDALSVLPSRMAVSRFTWRLALGCRARLRLWSCWPLVTHELVLASLVLCDCSWEGEKLTFRLACAPLGAVGGGSGGASGGARGGAKGGARGGAGGGDGAGCDCDERVFGCAATVVGNGGGDAGDCIGIRGGDDDHGDGFEAPSEGEGDGDESVTSAFDDAMEGDGGGGGDGDESGSWNWGGSGDGTDAGGTASGHPCFW